MRILKAGMLSIAAALALIGSAARADTLSPNPSFTGCHITVAGGGSAAHTRLAVDGEGSIEHLGSQGFAGRTGGGCNLHWLPTGLLVGIGADYTLQDVEFRLNPGFRASLDESWTVYGRAGVVSGKALYYGFGGYTEAKWSTSVPGLPTPDLRGWTAGAGIDVKLTDTVSAGAEYRFTRFDSVRIGEVELETDQHSLMVTLSLSFSGR